MAFALTKLAVVSTLHRGRNKSDKLRDGIDGMWSTFEVEIGDPGMLIRFLGPYLHLRTSGQTVRLLPGTSAYTGNVVSVVTPQGCSQDPAIANCTASRGNVFFRNQSSSWSTHGLPNGGTSALERASQDSLILAENSSYGFDTLRFPCPDVPLVANLMVAEYSTSEFWLGTLGLSPLASNFSDSNVSAPSLLSVPRQRGGIDSLSWAYTAGAYYKSVFGSLTLGGYDESRFDQNKSITVPFAADPSRDLVVGIQSITHNIPGGDVLGGGFYAFIDSMVSQMWLPESVCDRFEQAFNLTWNSTSELYLVDEELHKDLVRRNSTITFNLGGADALANGQTVGIELPYEAFDLNISAPLVDQKSRYFPLKRANSTTQYTLGRMFLQAAYVVADYDKSEFLVAQALYPRIYDRKSLVAILHPKGTQPSKATITGVTVGAIVAVGMCGGFAALAMSRRRQRQQINTTAAENDEKRDLDDLGSSSSSTKSIAELSGTETQIHEAQDNRGDLPELPEKKRASVRYEMFSGIAVAELDSSCRS